MISYSTTKARQNFAALLEASAREPVVIRRNQRDVAIVISPAEYARLHRLNVEQLLAVCLQLGDEAAANGLTEAKLAELLAGDA